MEVIKNISSTLLTSFLIMIFAFVFATFITSKTPLLLDIRSFIVLSGSMEPLFPVGSMVYAQKQGTYNVGDIITFKNSSDQNVTHRIVAINTESGTISYITKGDANSVVDQTPIPANTVVGKVFFFLPYIGHIVNAMKTPPFFIAFIVVPSLIFIAMELWNIKKEIERMTEKRVLERMQKEQAQA